eukprot:CAMPEP_0170518066 /NCGR_PEP_ID=MMETSP0209-20121228/3848_1 /TAXON_ID=665100 ORGANISM="Litonotus pictus, Strain P1" /NCGR_SAMPLE_ID=MMETSP0209 /ASSEMBLY_ACC=CAM_ASM_000301 /LENGTH=375 /DNA_ID=CAMNT_0010803493 /DNA_START=264 /DNA_END=1388 /DNA_ORIENTATION=-
MEDDRERDIFIPFPIQTMNVNPFEDMLKMIMNDMVNFDDDSDDSLLSLEEEEEKDIKEGDWQDSMSPFVKNTKRKHGKGGKEVKGRRPLVKEVAIEVTPFGKKETITTHNPDGSKIVEVHISQNKQMPNPNDGVPIIIGNLNRGRKERTATPMKLFSGIDSTFDDLLHDILFGEDLAVIDLTNDVIAKKNDDVLPTGDDLSLDEEKEDDRKEKSSLEENKQLKDSKQDMEITEVSKDKDTKEEKENATKGKKSDDDYTFHDKIKVKDKIQINKGGEPSAPDHSLVVVSSQEEDIIDDTVRRARRKKLIEDLKKEQPTKSLLVKIVKFICYIIGFCLFAFGLRVLLEILGIVQRENLIKIEKDKNIEENGKLEDSK